MHMLNRLPMYFAPDDEQGGGFSVEGAVTKLGEQRAAEAKEPKEPKAETPRKDVAPVITDKEPEEAPETGDAQAEESVEQSPEEKLAAELEKEQTPVSDTKLPLGWSEADRDLWSSLTPEVQSKIEQREKARDAGVRKRLNEADSAKKHADTVAEQLKAERQRLAPILQSTTNALIAKMVEEFPGVDPRDPASVTRFAMEHPDRYPAYDALWKQIGAVAHHQKQVEAEHKQREEAEYSTFAESRVTRLLELDETLKDPARSAAFEKEVVEYLMEGNGYGKIDPERIKHYTAEELLMARKARLYDRVWRGREQGSREGRRRRNLPWRNASRRPAASRTQSSS
jgi:hypothetical protein